MLVKKSLLAASTVAALATSSVVWASVAVADPALGGTFNAISPTRIVDTRSGVGLPAARIGAEKTVTFNAVSKVPSHSASAVALTVTALAPASGGHLVVYSAGGAGAATTSNLSFSPGQNTPNAIVAGVSSGGKVNIYNRSHGAVDVLVDITGYWTRGRVSSTTGGALTTVPLARAYDSRTGGHAATPADSSTTVPIAGKAGVPSSGVSAVAVNLTVASPRVGGSLTVTAAAADQTATSRTTTVHFVKGASRGGLAIVPVNTDGTISVYNGAAGKVDFAVDVEGYFTDGTPTADGALVTTTPYRAADTRTGSPVAADKAKSVSLVPGNASLFKSAVVSITEVSPTSSGHLVVWNGNAKRPGTSTGNFTRKQTSTTIAVVTLTADGSFSIFNSSPGTVDLVVDVQGFILNSSSTADAPTVTQVHQALNRARTYSAKALSK